MIGLNTTRTLILIPLLLWTSLGLAEGSEEAIARVRKELEAHSNRSPASAKTIPIRKPTLEPSNPSGVEDKVPVAEASAPEEEPSYLTGDWAGRRRKWSDSGIDLGLIYKGEFNKVLNGGLRQRSVYLENLDVRFNMDLEKSVGLKGGSFFFYALADKGADRDQSPSKNVGDLQGTSNIETAVDDFKPYELWYQQLLLEDKVSILFGLHDLNSEFYNNDSASSFFNASFGVGRELSQTGVNGPSIFPITSTALRLRAEPTKSFYIMTAIFNAQAGDPNSLKGLQFRFGGGDGFLAITETGWVGTQSGKSSLPHKYALGSWSYNRTFDSVSTNVTDSLGNSTPVKVSNSGAYLIGDQNLTPLSSVFLRYGVAANQPNKSSSCLTSGFVTKGLLSWRPKDKLSLGVAIATPTPDYNTASGGGLTSSETTYELNYRIELPKGLVVQPDYQYVVNPSYRNTIPNAQVFATRFEINF